MRGLFYPACGPMPYESIFSIYLKVSHANFLDFSMLGKRTLEIISHRQWVNHRLTRGLELKFPRIAEHLPWSYAPTIGLSPPTSKFSFCKECIKFGYHSVFNTIRLHRICVLHKCALSVSCASCANSFLRGFRTSEPIPRLMSPCEVCGFQDVGFYKEITMRRSRSLLAALEHFGASQARWYRSIHNLEFTLGEYCNLYYEQEVFREELTGPLESITRMQSPETTARLPPDCLPIVLVSKLKYDLKSISAVWVAKHYSLPEVCAQLERRYLANHLTCLSALNIITDYPDGTERAANLCPTALSYVLFRMKYIYGVWPTPGSTSTFINYVNGSEHMSPTLVPVFTYREAVLIFLSMLGRLQYHVSQSQNFLILCRPEIGYLYGYDTPILFKKTSYVFRRSCHVRGPKIQVFRDGIGGPLSIVFGANKHNPNNVGSLKQVIF